MSPLKRCIDHRTLVAKKRRVQMRKRLIEAATLVFAERGPEATLIDHIIHEAGVSRGSFYNYFRSIDELLEEAKFNLAEEIISVVSTTASKETDPAVALSYGLNWFIRIAMEYPLYLDFTAKLGTQGLGQGSMMRETTPPIIRMGIETGRFCAMSEQTAADILETTGLAILRRLLAGETVDLPSYAAAILRMLGIAPDEAAEIAARPVPDITVPDDLLIARSAGRSTT